MNNEACETAARVLAWAMDPGEKPPVGALHGLETLADPPPALRDALRRLATVTAARLGLADPPMGEDGREVLDPSTVWLAAAAGGGVFPEAVEIARCAPPPRSVWDLVVRHGLVEPLLRREQRPAFGMDLASALLAASPLTALLRFPLEGEEDRISSLCLDLSRSRDGRRLLAIRLGQPHQEPAVLTWRALLLDRLRLQLEDGLPLVLDIYEAATTQHAEAWLRTIHEARGIMAHFQDDETRLPWVVAVGGWWQPLRSLRKANIHLLRQRPFLDFELYLQGVRLASYVALLTGKESLP